MTVQKSDIKINKGRMQNIRPFDYVRYLHLLVFNVKPHKGINNMTPMEKLLEYFYPDEI